MIMLAACASSPTGSTCPTSSAPDYGNFGAGFFDTYCVACHSSEAADRHGAPLDQNFDTEADVLKHLDDIDFAAASGPNATNTDMPDLSGPVKAAPTMADRVRLGQFLACEKQKQ